MYIAVHARDPETLNGPVNTVIDFKSFKFSNYRKICFVNLTKKLKQKVYIEFSKSVVLKSYLRVKKYEDLWRSF